MRWLLLTLFVAAPLSDRDCLGFDQLIHLRNGEREWDSFPIQADAPSLSHSFTVFEGKFPKSISLQQIDVKQQWAIQINGKPLGRLARNLAEYCHQIS